MQNAKNTRMFEYITSHFVECKLARFFFIHNPLQHKIGHTDWAKRAVIDDSSLADDTTYCLDFNDLCA